MTELVIRATEIEDGKYRFQVEDNTDGEGRVITNEVLDGVAEVSVAIMQIGLQSVMTVTGLTWQNLPHIEEEKSKEEPSDEAG